MTSRRTILRTMVLASGVIATSALPAFCLDAPTAPEPINGIALPEDDIHVPLWACWIGHSTVLLRIGGMWVLTDPVLYEAYGMAVLGVTIGPRRVREAAIPFENLPKPDLVLLSHAHMDHMDRATLRAIALRWPNSIDVITATNTRDVIDDLPWKSLNEIDWCETVRIGSITLTALEVRHNGWRLPGEPCRAAGYKRTGRSYNGYNIEFDGINVVFGGDTAYTNQFKHIVHAPDLAIMPIGAYDPFPETHCTPEECLAMVEMMKARSIMPIHHSTFRQSEEPLHDPIRRLRRALRKSSTELAVHGIGGSYQIAGQST